MSGRYRFVIPGDKSRRCEESPVNSQIPITKLTVKHRYTDGYSVTTPSKSLRQKFKNPCLSVPRCWPSIATSEITEKEIIINDSLYCAADNVDSEDCDTIDISNDNLKTSKGYQTSLSPNIANSSKPRCVRECDDGDVLLFDVSPNLCHFEDPENSGLHSPTLKISGKRNSYQLHRNLSQLPADRCKRIRTVVDTKPRFESNIYSTTPTMKRAKYLVDARRSPCLQSLSHSRLPFTSLNVFNGRVNQIYTDHTTEQLGEQTVSPGPRFMLSGFATNAVPQHNNADTWKQTLAKCLRTPDVTEGNCSSQPAWLTLTPNPMVFSPHRRRAHGGKRTSEVDEVKNRQLVQGGLAEKVCCWMLDDITRFKFDFLPVRQSSSRVMEPTVTLRIAMLGRNEARYLHSVLELTLTNVKVASGLALAKRVLPLAHTCLILHAFYEDDKMESGSEGREIEYVCSAVGTDMAPKENTCMRYGNVLHVALMGGMLAIDNIMKSKRGEEKSNDANLVQLPTAQNLELRLSYTFPARSWHINIPKEVKNYDVNYEMDQTTDQIKWFIVSGGTLTVK